MRLTDTNLETVAAALGVGKSQASARLNGHTRWAADDVARLAQLWGIEPGLFFLPIEQIKPRVFETITRLKSGITGKEAGQRLASVKTHPRPRLTADRAIVRGVPATVAD